MAGQKCIVSLLIKPSLVSGVHQSGPYTDQEWLKGWLDIEWQRFSDFGSSCDEKSMGEDLWMLVSRYISDNYDKVISSVVCIPW